MKAVPEAAAVRPLLVTPGPGHQVCQCVSALLGVSEILAVGDRMGNNCVPSPEGESAAKRSEPLTPTLLHALLRRRMQQRGHKLPTS